jgi:hypothetical protein
VAEWQSAAALRPISCVHCGVHPLCSGRASTVDSHTFAYARVRSPLRVPRRSRAAECQSSRAAALQCSSAAEEQCGSSAAAMLYSDVMMMLTQPSQIDNLRSLERIRPEISRPSTADYAVMGCRAPPRPQQHSSYAAEQQCASVHSWFFPRSTGDARASVEARVRVSSFFCLGVPTGC